MNRRLLLPALLCLAVSTARADEALEEYQALAKVIRHFLAMVTWPGTPDRPMRLAVLGGNGFGTDLDVALGRGTVGGRRVDIRYLNLDAFLASTQDFDALFIDRGEEARLAQILPKVKGRPVLTMGYADGLGRKGIMVNFVLQGGRMNFEVNPGRLKESGITVNSRLMSIARIVEG